MKQLLLALFLSLAAHLLQAKTLSFSRDTLPPDTTVASMLLNRAQSALSSRKYDSAGIFVQQSLAIYRAAPGAAPVALAKALIVQARFLNSQRQYSKALDTLALSESLLSSSMPTDSLTLASLYLNRGISYHSLRRFSEAVVWKKRPTTFIRGIYLSRVSCAVS
ncbi:MAG: hypothetical protein HC821_00525 [Lewinella sp.]|nr:hypothetical protein [Lewinella sp.]